MESVLIYHQSHMNHRTAVIKRYHNITMVLSMVCLCLCCTHNTQICAQVGEHSFHWLGHLVWAAFILNISQHVLNQPFWILIPPISSVRNRRLSLWTGWYNRHHEVCLLFCKCLLNFTVLRSPPSFWYNQSHFAYQFLYLGPWEDHCLYISTNSGTLNSHLNSSGTSCRQI